jgi:signal transduction histidine kinase
MKGVGLRTGNGAAQERDKGTISRRNLRRSLRFRLTASFVGAFGLILTMACILAFVTARQDVLSDTDTVLALEADRFTDRQVMRYFEGPQYAEQPHLSPIVPLIYLRAVDVATGRQLVTSGELSRRSDLRPSLNFVIHALHPEQITPDAIPKNHFTFVAPDETQWMRVLTRVTAVDGHEVYIQAAMPWRRTELVLKRVALMTAAVMLVVLAASAFAGWKLVSSTLAPIDRIVTEVTRLDPTDLPDSLLPEPPETDSEVGNLVATLNGMVTRLRSAFESQARYAEAQQRFAADASHELRTPLTILRGEIELALSRPRPPEDYQQTLQSALEEINHMAGIVEGLGTLARHDAGVISPASLEQDVDLKAVVLESLDAYRPVAQEKGIDLKGELSSEPLSVRGHATQVERLIGNLIDNALKYTPEGGTVTVTLARVPEGTIRISVADTGIGISGDDLPHLFDRFWRSDPARTTTGMGLGLSICAAIAQAHNGRILVESRPGAGSTFTVELPCGE